MIVLSSASQAPVLGALQHINIFACPLPESKQITMIQCVVTVSDTGTGAALQVLIPIPREASFTNAAACISNFFDVLHQCFPRSVPIHATIPHCGATLDVPEEEVEAFIHETHVKRSKHASVVEAVPHAIGVTSLQNVAASARIVSMDSALKIVSPKLQTSLRTLYPDSDVMLVDVPSGREGEQYALVVKVVHPRPSPHTLWVPLRATIPEDVSASAFEPSAATGAGADITLFTVGSVRRSDWSGGGKTSEETFEDMRHRFASGSFRRLEAASCKWESVRKNLKVIPAELRGIFDDVHHMERSEPFRAPYLADELREHRVSFSDKDLEHEAAHAAVDAAFIPSLGCTDVLRQRKIVASPDIDLQIQLDDGKDDTRPA